MKTLVEHLARCLTHSSSSINGRCYILTTSWETGTVIPGHGRRLGPAPWMFLSGRGHTQTYSCQIPKPRWPTAATPGTGPLLVARGPSPGLLLRFLNHGPVNLGSDRTSQLSKPWQWSRQPYQVATVTTIMREAQETTHVCLTSLPLSLMPCHAQTGT